MNKSLEAEYKDLVRIDLPDLWGKIEEKLDAQEAAAQTNVVEFPKTVTVAQNDQIDKKEKLEKIFADQPETDAIGKNVVPLKKKKRSIPWRYFGVAAAAVLCLLVAIPVMNMTRNSGTSTAPQPASADCGSAMTAEPAAAEETTMEAEMAEKVQPTESVNDNANSVKISDVLGNDREERKSENGDTTYSATQTTHIVSSETLGGESQGSATATEETDAATETDNVEDAEEEMETVMAPGAANVERKAFFLISTIGEDISEKQLTQMMEQLQKDIDPNLSLVLQDADEQDVYEQNGRFTHVMVLAGVMTEKQRKDEVDCILQELQNYNFISIRDIQFSED